MHCSQKNCIYGWNDSLLRQAQGVIIYGTVAAAGAVSINSIALFLMGLDDMYPALIGGSSMAVSVGLVHKLQHAFDNGKVRTNDTNQESKWEGSEELAGFTLTIIMSSGLTVWGLRHWKYKVNKWDVFRLEALSLVGIAMSSKLVNEK